MRAGRATSERDPRDLCVQPRRRRCAPCRFHVPLSPPLSSALCSLLGCLFSLLALFLSSRVFAARVSASLEVFRDPCARVYISSDVAVDCAAWSAISKNAARLCKYESETVKLFAPCISLLTAAQLPPSYIKSSLKTRINLCMCCLWGCVVPVHCVLCVQFTRMSTLTALLLTCTLVLEELCLTHKNYGSPPIMRETCACMRDPLCSARLFFMQRSSFLHLTFVQIIFMYINACQFSVFISATPVFTHC